MPASPSDNLTPAMIPGPMSINAARKSIVVRAAVTHVYEQWSQIEDLPKFITSLREVRRIDDSRFSYTWSGSCRSDEHPGVFHIVLRIPDRRIAWRSMSNGFMSGVVSFEPCSDQETEITLKIRSMFDPASLSQRVEQYLHNFKRLVEDQGDRKAEKGGQ